jgi:hypothetical protein
MSAKGAVVSSDTVAGDAVAKRSPTRHRKILDGIKEGINIDQT